MWKCNMLETNQSHPTNTQIPYAFISPAHEISRGKSKINVQTYPILFSNKIQCDLYRFVKLSLLLYQVRNNIKSSTMINQYGQWYGTYSETKLLLLHQEICYSKEIFPPFPITHKNLIRAGFTSDFYGFWCFESGMSLVYIRELRLFSVESRFRRRFFFVYSTCQVITSILAHLSQK